ncbi:MAG: hypothetical protein J6A15_00735 [Clostridia bacterium]|nr:hypothetical protein [Clostridia bacterium]
MSYFDYLLDFIESEDEYYLQKLVTYKKSNQKIKDEVGNIIRKDEVGNISEEWEDIKQLHGTIQHRQDDDVGYQGQESDITYHGYFSPTFKLETNQLSKYRVKFVRDYETLYLNIIQYDPNNYLLGEQHHITLVMQEDRKYKGRQK